MSHMPVMAMREAATAAEGAGGAPIWQLAVLALVYWGGTLGLIVLIRGHRSGRSQVLARAASGASWVFRLPGWAALPVALSVAGLLLAMWAGVWDIGYHVDNGRDSGPLGNPGHLPLLLGLFLTFAGGLLALGLADRNHATPAWVRLTPNWPVPLGGVILTGCMAFGMSALALDDLWHRVYGQDVTLWSPTHLIYLCGGVLTVLGMLVLVKEGAAARDRSAFHGRPSALASFWRRVQRAALLGGLLCGLELFLAEFDYGVPLYRQVWQPLLLAAFAGFVLVAARAWLGRGGALGAVGVYLVVRVTGIVIPAVAGVSPSSMPLFLGEAFAVEALALALAPRRAPLAFGAIAGLLCGTVGFAAEYGWSHVAMPLPWTSALLPEGLVLAALGGTAAGVLGALLATALRGELPRPVVARAAFTGATSLLAVLAFVAGSRETPAAVAHVQLTDTSPAPAREALATVRIEPASAAAETNWLYVLAWQGGDKRVVDRLRRSGEGTWESTRPIPLHGTWKSGLRMNAGRARGAVPLRLPSDEALDGSEQALPERPETAGFDDRLRESAGAELTAPASFTRPFVDDALIVLRETKGDVPGWVWTSGIALSALVWLTFFVTVALGIGRMGRRGRVAARTTAAGRGGTAHALPSTTWGDGF